MTLLLVASQSRTSATGIVLLNRNDAVSAAPNAAPSGRVTAW